MCGTRRIVPEACQWNPHLELANAWWQLTQGVAGEVEADKLGAGANGAWHLLQTPACLWHACFVQLAANEDMAEAEKAAKTAQMSP